MARRGIQRPAGARTARRTPAVSFPALCAAYGLPAPTPEYRFHPVRKWRIDWAWVEHRIGLEIDGGVWIGGRHTRGAGWAKDTEKLNTLAALGWRMFRTTPSGVADVLPLIAGAVVCGTGQA